MTGLDTNVLVRHLTQDDPVQSPLASAAIARHCTLETPGFVNRVVLCELVWVLSRSYRYSRAEVGEVIEALLRASDLRLEDEGAVWAALSLHRAGFDFADALIGLTNRDRGVAETLTLDAAAAGMAGFREVAAGA